MLDFYLFLPLSTSKSLGQDSQNKHRNILYIGEKADWFGSSGPEKWKVWFIYPKLGAEEYYNSEMPTGRAKNNKTPKKRLFFLAKGRWKEQSSKKNNFQIIATLFRQALHKLWPHLYPCQERLSWDPRRSFSWVYSEVYTPTSWLKWYPG